MPSTGSRLNRFGATLLAAMLVAGGALASAPAFAQEGDGGGDKAQEAETKRQAYYSAPISKVLPETVVGELPPGVLCILRPEVCRPELDPVKENSKTLVDTGKENEPESAPVEPVPPGTLPVSVVAGQQRYRSAVQFALPEVAEGDQVDLFQVILSETQPTYGGSSPAFRQAVVALLSSTGGPNFEEFEKVLTKDCEGNNEGGPCPWEEDLLPVEMCPITTKWEADETSSQGEKKIPEVDCLYGGNGERDENGNWTFDLTFALGAWSEGELPVQGVLIRPQDAPNLAFGDPDTSYTKQVTFENTVRYKVETSEAPEPITFDAPPPPPAQDAGSADGGETGAGFSTDSGGITSPSSSAPAAGGGGDFGTSAPMSADTGGGSAPAPEVAADAPEQVAAGPAAAEPGQVWWMWLLVPVFLGGMYTTAQSLSAPVQVAASREGAMSRLIAKRQAAMAGSGPELVDL
jgi:hypothetical protein